MYELPKIDVSGFRPIDLNVRLERSGGYVAIGITYRAPDSCGDDKFVTVGSSTIVKESELQQAPMMWQGELLKGLVNAMEHELMETIKINGVRVFNPHATIRSYPIYPNIGNQLTAGHLAEFISSPEGRAARKAFLARLR